MWRGRFTKANCDQVRVACAPGFRQVSNRLSYPSLFLLEVLAPNSAPPFVDGRGESGPLTFRRPGRSGRRAWPSPCPGAVDLAGLRSRIVFEASTIKVV